MVHKYFVLYSCKNSLLDAGIDEYFYKSTEKIFSKKKSDNLSPWCFSKTYKDVNGLYSAWRLFMALYEVQPVHWNKKWYKNIWTYIQMANKYKKSPWKILFCKHFRSTVCVKPWKLLVKYSIKQETFKRTSLTEVPTKNYLISVVLLSETKDICSLKRCICEKKSYA